MCAVKIVKNKWKDKERKSKFNKNNKKLRTALEKGDSERT